MRMKKLFIFAVAAITLAACSRTFDSHTAEPTQIGFNTWAEVLTKTPRIAGTSTFGEGDTFAVYGSKTKTSPATTQTVFNGDVVTLGASAWDYDNHRYWDTNFDNYTFYAVSPATLAGTVDPASGAITTSVDFAGNDNDILIANKTLVEKGDAPYFNNYGTVNMVFNHAASLVDVYVKKAPSLDADVVKVSAISIDNVNKTGALSVSAYDGTTGVPTIALANWTPSAPGSYLPADGAVAVYGDVTTDAAIAAANQKTIVNDTSFNPENATANTDPAAATILFNNLVVAPQAFVAPTDRENPANASNSSAQKITISYSVGDSNYENKTIWLYDFDHVDNSQQAADYVGSWEPGKHYKLYITILAHAITFSASITDWDTTIVNGYNYLVN